MIMLLIHPHIVDFHALWPDGFVNAFLSTPAATHGNIQDHKERLFKWPFCYYVSTKSFIKDILFLLVHEEVYSVGSPFNSVLVKAPTIPPLYRIYVPF